MKRSQTQPKPSRGCRRGIVDEPSLLVGAERKTIIKEREEGSTEMEAAGEEEQEGLSIHLVGQIELELRLLEALEMYPLSRLQGFHCHFVLYGLMEYLMKSFDRQFTSEEVLRLLDRFYNLEVMKPGDEEAEILNKEDEFSQPQFFHQG